MMPDKLVHLFTLKNALESVPLSSAGKYKVDTLTLKRKGIALMSGILSFIHFWSITKQMFVLVFLQTLWQRSLTPFRPLVVAKWHKDCWLGLEDSAGVWLLGLRWGLCCCDNLISTEDGVSDTEGTDDTGTEGTNFLSGGFNVCKYSTWKYINVNSVLGIIISGMTKSSNDDIKQSDHMAWATFHSKHILLSTPPGFACLTWVGNRGDSDFVIGFTRAKACDYILNPPQLFSDLDFFLLLAETQRHTSFVVQGKHLQIKVYFAK